jgi:hypothetical protein
VWIGEEFTGPSNALGYLVNLSFDRERGFGHNGLRGSTQSLPPLYLIRGGGTAETEEAPRIYAHVTQSPSPASPFEAFASMVCFRPKLDALAIGANVLDMAWLGQENTTVTLTCSQLTLALGFGDATHSHEEIWAEVFGA